MFEILNFFTYRSVQNGCLVNQGLALLHGRSGHDRFQIDIFFLSSIIQQSSLNKANYLIVKALSCLFNAQPT